VTGPDHVPSPSVVSTPAALDELIKRLLTAERYALDTEFHRERTYWPHLALVQVAWPDGAAGPAGVALIDPLAVDVGPLARLLDSSAEMVAHAADQDLEVLENACGTVPARLFDTQVAAGFLGYGSASLAALASTFLQLGLPKGDRLTDWSQRPLTAGQLSYAAADVAHLLALADAITAALIEAGRLAWAEEECRALLSRAHRPGDPERAWWKLRDSRQLRGAARSVAQEVAAWREERARLTDQPARFVLPDLALQAIAHSQPRTRAALDQVRGLDQRHLRGQAPGQILAAVEQGRSLPANRVQLPPVDEVDREMRPAVALAAAWVAQLARDQRIDAALLATRGDLVAFLRTNGKSRLGQGWRAAMVGEPVSRLIRGDAALAFDGGGRLVLEIRSGEPLPVPTDATPLAATVGVAPVWADLPSGSADGGDGRDERAAAGEGG
jgi:ribonuclease D